MRKSLYIALLVAFIDYIGIGLCLPLFSSLLFSPTSQLLSSETTYDVRGILLGALLALSPLLQFFSAPIWGALSDSKGRKKPLQTFIGYVIAAFGIFCGSLILLLASRVFIGLSAGNISIVQATIADISSSEDKAKNFGLFSMSIGAGFALGPFFGGILSGWDMSVPFIAACFIVALNLLLAYYFFHETNHNRLLKKLSFKVGLTNLKKAFYGIRTVIFTYFFHCFAWSFFFEFVPVYLISKFGFTSREIGFFYAAEGAIYALSTGLLIRPFVKRFKPQTLYIMGNILTGIVLLLLPCFHSAGWIWPFVLMNAFFVAFVSPTATTLVSNSASAQIQGEALGTLSSFYAAALVLSPILSGSFVGGYPVLSMWISGSILVLTGCAAFISFRKKLLKAL
jgi:DHA1 family tetracycline resistance protein-like MFS transporter